MEPAADRREYAIYMSLSAVTPVVPQWSPPLTGGSTGTPVGTTAMKLRLPQWSPPATGGST